MCPIRKTRSGTPPRSTPPDPAVPDGIRQTIRRLRIITARRVNERFLGDYHAVFRGRGIEFDEVRDYCYGDDARDIDWNVTARMGHPYIKRYREDRDVSVILAIDVSGSCFFGSGQQTKRDVAAELAGLLATSAERHRDRVGLLLFSDRIETYLPPRRKAGMTSQILNEIYRFRDPDRPTRIAEALRFLDRVRKRPAVVFLVSDFLDDACRDDMRQTAKRHDLIACLITDPLEQRIPRMGRIDIVDPEDRSVRILDTTAPSIQGGLPTWASDRQALLKRTLSRLGIDLITLQTGQSVAKPVHALFEKRRRHSLRTAGTGYPTVAS